MKKFTNNSSKVKKEKVRFLLLSESIDLNQDEMRTKVKEIRGEIQELQQEENNNTPNMNFTKIQGKKDEIQTITEPLQNEELEAGWYQDALDLCEARVREVGKQGVVNNSDYERKKISLEYLNFIFKNREKSKETKQYCDTLCRQILRDTDVFPDQFLGILDSFSEAYTRMQIKLQLCEYRYAIRDLEQKLRARDGLFKFSNGVTYELAKIQLDYLRRISNPENYTTINATKVLAYGEELLTAIEKKEPFPTPESSADFLKYYNEMNEKLTQLRKNQQSAINNVLNFYGEYNKVESYALNFIVKETLKDADLKPGNIYITRKLVGKEFEYDLTVRSFAGQIYRPIELDSIAGFEKLKARLASKLKWVEESQYNIQGDYAQRFINTCIDNSNQYFNGNPNLKNEVRKTTVGERALLIARKWSKGRLYTGNYAQHENLIKLVERFALLQASSVSALQAAFNDKKNLSDQEKIQKFIDQAYNSFSDLQDELVGRISSHAQAVFDNLSVECFKKIECFKVDNDLNPRRQQEKNLHEEIILSYLKGEIKHTDDKFMELLERADKPNTLRLQLRLAKAELKKEKAGYDLELKKLKRDLHHVCEEYGFASHLEVKKANFSAARYEFNKDKNLKITVSSEKQKKRAIKLENSKISPVVAVFFGIGEGIVAAAGLLSLVAAYMLFPYVAIPLTIAIVLVGIGGFYCNYYLIKTDSKEILDMFRLDKFFINSKGEEVSFPRKCAMVFFASLSFFASVVFTCLSAYSLQLILMPILMGFGLAGLGLTLTTLLLVSGPIGFTAIGLFCMFFAVIGDFVKEARWNDIKKYFRNKFYAPWSEMSGVERALHIAECVFNILKLALGITIVTVVNVLTFGLLYKKTLTILSMIANAPSLLSIFSAVATGITNSINFVFGAKKVDVLLQPITLKSVVALTLKAVPFLVNVAVRVITSPLVVADWALKKASNNKIDIQNPFEGVFDYVYRKIDDLVGRKPVNNHITPATIAQSAEGNTQGAKAAAGNFAIFLNSLIGQGCMAWVGQVNVWISMLAGSSAGFFSASNNNLNYKKATKATSTPKTSDDTPPPKGADNQAHPSLAGIFAKKESNGKENHNNNQDNTIENTGVSFEK